MTSQDQPIQVGEVQLDKPTNDLMLDLNSATEVLLKHDRRLASAVSIARYKILKAAERDMTVDWVKIDRQLLRILGKRSSDDEAQTINELRALLRKVSGFR